MWRNIGHTNVFHLPNLRSIFPSYAYDFVFSIIVHFVVGVRFPFSKIWFNKWQFWRVLYIRKGNKITANTRYLFMSNFLNGENFFTGSSGFVEAQVITVDIRIKYLFLDSPEPPLASGSTDAVVDGFCLSRSSLRTVYKLNSCYITIRDTEMTAHI